MVVKARVAEPPRGVVRPHPDVSEGDPRVGDDAPSAHVLEVCHVVEQLIGLAVDSVDVSEIFNPERFVGRASAFHLTPGTAFDLRTGWDLSDPTQQEQCWAQLRIEEPEVIIGSPMCGPFSRGPG